MSQTQQISSVPTEIEQQFPNAEDWFFSDLFFGLMIPATILLWIVGSIIILLS